MTLEQLLRMPTGQRVAVDVETTNGIGATKKDKRINPDDWCKCGCGRRVHITMVAVAGDSFAESFPFAAIEAENLNESAWTDLLEWLAGQHLELWNAPFDLGHLDRGAPNGWKGRDLLDAFDWDGMLASWVIWPLNLIGLDAVGRRLYGEEGAKDDSELQKYLKSLPGARKGEPSQQGDYWRVPFPIQGKYNAKDAAITHRIIGDQRILIANGSVNDISIDEDPSEIIEREFNVMKVLFRMMQRGIQFDKDEALSLAEAMTLRIDVVEKMLPFPATNLQAIKYWRNEGFNNIVETLPLTKKGAPSLDVRGIKVAINANLPGAKLLEEHRALKRGISLWFGEEGWPMRVGPDGRLRTEYRQTGAVTMRFSSSRVNLQAIPKEQTIDKYLPNVRKLFSAKPGHTLVELDLNNAELRIATGYARCDPMLQHFLAGTDIHDDTTRKVFHIDKDHPRWDDYRRDAKIVTFAMLYGAGPDGLVLAMEKQGREIDYPTAYQLRDAFRSIYPEFFAMTKEAARKAEQRGYIKLITGRKRHFGLREVYDRGRVQLIEDNTWDAFNSLVQGGTAEIMKTAMLYVEDHWPGILLLQVHDSLVMEIRNDMINEITTDVVQWVEKTATNAFKIPMKMKVETWNKK